MSMPICPECNAPLTMNLRMDLRFVQDVGWYKALSRYEKFLEENKNKKVLYLELGVGQNTPSIIKYPFWQLTKANKHATYVCITFNDAYVPNEILQQSICLSEDINKVINDISNL